MTQFAGRPQRQARDIYRLALAPPVSRDQTSPHDDFREDHPLYAPAATDFHLESAVGIDRQVLERAVPCFTASVTDSNPGRLRRQCAIRNHDVARPESPDAVDLGSSEPIRSFRSRHECSAAAPMIQTAPRERNVGSTPIRSVLGRARKTIRGPEARRSEDAESTRVLTARSSDGRDQQRTGTCRSQSGSPSIQGQYTLPQTRVPGSYVLSTVRPGRLLIRREGDDPRQKPIFSCTGPGLGSNYFAVTGSKSK